MLPTIATGNVGSALAGEYEVANSLRFDDDSTDYLTRTPSSAGNRKTWTFSTWIKRNNLGTNQDIFGSHISLSGSGVLRFLFESNDTIGIQAYTTFNQKTVRVFRDTSAWYHIVLAVDTTQSTDTNRIKLYINGVQETSFTGTLITQNLDTAINNSQIHTIGRYRLTTNNYLDCYMAETVLIDGQQLDATSFGEFDEDSGIWKPKDVSGLTFGTNGFYLDFENSGSLGADVSGNNNDWTPNNLTSIDQSIDTCTNNFCTLSSLNPTQQATLSQGNLKAESSSAYKIALSTIAVSSGKWFLEHKIGSSPNLLVGVIDSQDYNSDNAINFVGENTNSVGYFSFNGKKYIANANSTYGATYTENDIIGLALDLDSGTKTITFYKNGASQGSINLPTAGSQEFYFLPSPYNGSIEMNFGSPPYSETGGNSDANGYGNFSMAVPSGHYCLCTKNLAEYG